MACTVPESSKFRRLLDGKVDKIQFFGLTWRAFNISSHLIIVSIYISHVVFPILIVHHFLCIKPLQNIDFSKVGNMQFFFQELYSHIDKNSGKKKFLGHVSRQNNKKGNLLKNCLKMDQI